MPPALTFRHPNVADILPTVRDSGTDRDFQHHRISNFNIVIPQSKGQAIARAMVAGNIAAPAPNLGTDRGLRPIGAGYVLEYTSTLSWNEKI